MTWTSYIAIGDSFSEGMCDPNPDVPNAFHGWTDRLAHILSVQAAAEGQEFRYANLAIRGRTLRPILDEQLEPALAQHPELISIIGGGNDLLRPHGDPDTLAALLEDAVVRARSQGADVLLATTTDTRKSALYRWMSARSAAYTANIWSIAARHGAHVLDQWSLESIRDPRMWADDRLHMTPEGHHRVAVQAARALGVPVDDAGTNTLAPAPRTPWRESAQANRAWAQTHFAPWVQRRLTGRSSGDGLDPKRPVLAVLDPSEQLPAPRF